MPSQTLARSRLIDVAKRAGVSLASASRVLSHTGPVSDAVRRQVEAAALELGYQRRRPRTLEPPGMSDSVIALMITDTLNPYFHEIVKGAQDEAEMAGLFPIVVDGSADLDHQRRTLETLGEQHLAGVIACATELPAAELIRIYEQYRYPFVIINNNVAHPSIPCIMLDFERGAGRAAQHLISLGHTRIAYLGAAPEEGPTMERKRGIESAMRQNGLRFCEDCYVPSFPRVEGGYQSMIALLSRPLTERPSGIIVYNDIMAIGALHAARDLGLRVPDDVSVVGFDDIPLAAHTNPPLTTVAPPKYHLGKLAMQYMVQSRRGFMTQGGYTLIQCSMVIRDSTARCADVADVNGNERLGAVMGGDAPAKHLT